MSVLNIHGPPEKMGQQVVDHVVKVVGGESAYQMVATGYLMRNYLWIYEGLAELQRALRTMALIAAWSLHFMCGFHRRLCCWYM